MRPRDQPHRMRVVVALLPRLAHETVQLVVDVPIPAAVVCEVPQGLSSLDPELATDLLEVGLVDSEFLDPFRGYVSKVQSGA